MTNRTAKWTLTASAVGALGLAFLAGRAIASGIPAANVLTYSGYLEDATGAPVKTAQAIDVDLFAAQTGGTSLCQTNAPGTEVTNGRFSVLLNDTCVPFVKANPDLHVEVRVGGTPLGRTKLGAVPYAVEADHAVSATTATTASSAAGTLAGQIVPPGMIGMFAAACPGGWILCDGSGACPDLMNVYVKSGSAFAAATGSDTHSHPGSSATASAVSAGTPATSSVTVSSAGAHNHVAMTEYSSTYVYENAASTFLSNGSQVAVPSWTSNYRIQAAANWTASTTLTAMNGPLTTTEPAHTHSVSVSLQALPTHSHTISVSIPSANHEPRHATLVFCMKN